MNEIAKLKHRIKSLENQLEELARSDIRYREKSAKLQAENKRLKELLRYARSLPMNEAGDYEENKKWADEVEQILKDSK